MIAIAKVGIIAAVVTVVTVGVTVGVIYAVAPITNEDLLCRTVGEVSNLRLYHILGGLVAIWTSPQNAEFCDMQYLVNIYNNDQNNNLLLVVNETVTEERFVYETPEECNTYVVRVMGLASSGTPTNVVSRSLLVGEETECEGSGYGDEIVIDIGRSDSVDNDINYPFAEEIN